MEKLVFEKIKILYSLEKDLNINMFKSFKKIKKVFGPQKERNVCKSRISEYGKEPN